MPVLSFAPLPSECFFDEDLHIVVQGVCAGQQVRVQAASAGANGNVLLSEAVFASTGDTVDLRQCAPAQGSYTGVDDMGLFWSRTPRPEESVSFPVPIDADPMVITLCAQVDDGPAVSHAIRRLYFDDKVLRRKLRDEGLVAQVFEPAAPGIYPALLVLGGSGGGFGWCAEAAALLARHGFVTMALAYFGLEHLPASLECVPLEYFGVAREWLASHEKVDAERIGVMGASRGGELALLLASRQPFRSVVAYSPSGLVGSAYPGTGRSAWTWNGRELPYDEFLLPPGPNSHLSRGCIPVERIRGPVLLVTGKDDKVWPTSELTACALRRWEANAFPHEIRHLAYEDAGHSLGWPHVMTTVMDFRHPVSGASLMLGGTPAGTAYARRHSWRQVMAFLRHSLAVPQTI